MRYAFSFLLILITGSGVLSQTRREGSVSFMTTEHVYVRFSTMENISEGDTLYINQGSKEVPALQVLNLSSMSCVCIPLLKEALSLNDLVFAKVKPDLPDSVETAAKAEPEMSNQVTEISPDQTNSKGKGSLRQEVSGHISVSSYSNFYKDAAAPDQRMRYTFSLRANHLGNSKLSVESYLSFVHSNANWSEVKEDIFAGLKLYNFSVKYAFDESMYLSLGRKINPKLSSVGAIDGLQFEKKFKSLTLGAIAGSRPDYADYSINTNLLQYGIYVGHELVKKNGSMQNTLAFIEQTNQSMTDRRFAYFQHSNMLVKNLFLFASAEVDLYKKVDETPETVFDLSNTYVSLRYRIIRPLSVGLSYSARRNTIYYETYKDFLERLLENETLQGWRFRINYRPAKYLFIGANAGYRFRKEDPRPTKNLSGYLTYSRVPGIGASVTLSTTWLETSYLNGLVYGLGLSRDLVPGKLNAGLQYRYVDYLYQNSETALIQHVAEAKLSWMVYKKLSLSVYYEGTFETELLYHRLYINITQRF